MFNIRTDLLKTYIHIYIHTYKNIYIYSKKEAFVNSSHRQVKINLVCKNLYHIYKLV